MKKVSIIFLSVVMLSGASSWGQSTHPSGTAYEAQNWLQQNGHAAPFHENDDLRLDAGLLIKKKPTLFNRSSNAFTSNLPVIAPYFGLGYQLDLGKSRLEWSAQLGLTSVGDKNRVRFGDKITDNLQNLDDAVRQLRLSPILQFGLIYSF
jgi:hypothetical protein